MQTFIDELSDHAEEANDILREGVESTRKTILKTA